MLIYRRSRTYPSIARVAPKGFASRRIDPPLTRVSISKVDLSLGTP